MPSQKETKQAARTRFSAALTQEVRERSVAGTPIASIVRRPPFTKSFLDKATMESGAM